MGEARTNRVVDIDRSTTTPDQERVLERLQGGRGWLPTPYKIWIHSPAIAEGMEVLGTHLNTGSSLSPAELELAILLTAVFWGSPFVIKAHVKHGMKAGLSRDAVDAILAKQKPSLEGDRLRAVGDIVADALAGGGMSDTAYRHYEAALGRVGIAEILALIGYYTSVAIAMHMHEVKPAAD